MRAIYRREVQSYFNSMIAYVFIAAVVVFIGIYFMAYNMLGGYPYFSYALASTQIVVLVAIPILTMRSMAEERHSRTDQLLLTSPVSVGGIVLGKYFAILSVVAVPCLIAALCPLIIRLNGTAYLGNDYASLLAFFLLCGVFAAVGLFVSALTESQIIAAVGSFFVLLLLFLWDGLVGYLPTTSSGSLIGFLVLLALLCFLVSSLSDNWKVTAGTGAAGLAVLLTFYFTKKTAFAGLLPELLGKFSLTAVFDNFASYHVFDIRGLLLYLSLIALLLFLTALVTEKRRWN